MARITVEDCLDNVDNRFQLVLLAAKRARQLAMGHEPRVPWDDDKPTVVALREIAEEVIDLDAIMGIQQQAAEEEVVVHIEIPAPPEVPEDDL